MTRTAHTRRRGSRDCRATVDNEYGEKQVAETKEQQQV